MDQEKFDKARQLQNEIKNKKEIHLSLIKVLNGIDYKVIVSSMSSNINTCEIDTDFAMSLIEQYKFHIIGQIKSLQAEFDQL